MRVEFLIGAVLVCGLAVPVAAEAPKQVFCESILNSDFDLNKKLYGDRYSVDPAKLAAAWLPELERLSAAIPSLSPREEQWLENELTSEIVERIRHVYSSREYAMRYAKRNVHSLLILMNRLNKRQDITAQTRDWLWVIHSLIDSDSAYYLAGLEAEGVAQRRAIPVDWTILTGLGLNLEEAIRHGRIRLANHILACTIPSVLGFSMTPILR